MFLLLAAMICVCAVWLSRHIQVHVHYNDKEEQMNKTENPRPDNTMDTRSDNIVPVQTNVAYRQINDNRPVVKMGDDVLAAQQEMMKLNQFREIGRTPYDHLIPRQTAAVAYNHEAEDNVVVNSMYNQGGIQTRREMQFNSAGRHVHGHPTVPMTYEMTTMQNLNMLIDDEDHLYEYIQ